MIVWKTLCYLSVLFAFTSGLISYSRLDRSFRILTWLMGTTFLVECGALLLAYMCGTNLPLYNLFLIVQFFLIALFFNYSVDTFREQQIGIRIALTGAALGIGNYLFLQPLTKVGSYFHLLAAVAIIAMAIYSFYRFAFARDAMPSPSRDSRHLLHFWAGVSLAILSSTTFLLWGLYEYFTRQHENALPLVHLAMKAVNIISYTTIGTATMRFRYASKSPHA